MYDGVKIHVKGHRIIRLLDMHIKAFQQCLGCETVESAPKAERRSRVRDPMTRSVWLVGWLAVWLVGWSVTPSLCFLCCFSYLKLL